MQGSWAECGLPLLRALVAFGSPEISRTIFACETRAPVRWRRVWGNRPGACPPRRARRGAFVGHRPRIRPADGARAPPVLDCPAAGREGGARRERARGRVLHGAAHQRRVPLGRARASEVVRGRHRAQVPQIRSRVPQSGGFKAAVAGLRSIGTGYPASLHRFRVGLEFLAVGPSRGRRDDRPSRRDRPVARRAAEPAGLTGEDVPLPARISTMPEFLEVAYRASGRGMACGTPRHGSAEPLWRDGGDQER